MRPGAIALRRMRIPADVAVAAAVVILLCTAKPAAACYPAFTRAVVGRPAFEPADAVTIGGESVDVQCSEHGDCTVTWTLAVAAAKAANATVTGYVQELSLAADGRPQARATIASMHAAAGKPASVRRGWYSRSPAKPTSPTRGTSRSPPSR